MFALWDVDAAALHAPELHAVLAAAGVVRLQLNTDDEHVAAAMRIPTGPAPIAAVVSVWVPSVEAASLVTAALAAVTGTLAGWEVEERRPIEPPETWDGSRLDGLANIAILRRPDELDVEEWRNRWLVDHTPVAIETQATFGYLQNVVVAPVTAMPDDVAPVAALVEELFPAEAMTDMHAFYGSGGDDVELTDRITRLMASVARIGADRGLDLVPTSRHLYELSDRT
ncbi:hypothetical protein G7071_01295 [Nocardioides piscis]|uniref:EthD domain-containing protein n=2 Tax=Nocardioides piscis TaxID=2714938 RepID=A0A6G7YKB1_9ACTN|nr:hypothetical protein G7071_01295 [Nocardioides piscis]